MSDISNDDHGEVSSNDRASHKPKTAPTNATSPAKNGASKSKPVTPAETESELAAQLPLKVGNPASAASLSIDQEHLEDYASDEISTEVPYGRPPKGTYFTVLPEPTKPWKNRRFYHLLQLQDRDPYIVAPAIAKLRQDEDVIRPLLLVRYVTMAGDEGLWPVKLDLGEGKANPYNKSARAILDMASADKWVRMISAKGHYRFKVSPHDFDETPPQFSDRTYDQLVNLVFSPDRVVTTLDHEVWDALDKGSKR